MLVDQQYAIVPDKCWNIVMTEVCNSQYVRDMIHDADNAMTP